MPQERPKRYVLGVEDKQQKRQLEELLSYINPPDQVTSLVFLKPHEFETARRAFQLQHPHSMAFSHVNSGRIYLPIDDLRAPRILDSQLAHELGHFDRNTTDEREADEGAKSFRVMLEGFRNLQRNMRDIPNLPLLRTAGPSLDPQQQELASLLLLNPR